MRKAIQKLEEMIESWLKPLPRLPVSFKKWVAPNLWWIVLIGVVLSALSLLFMIGSLVTILSLLGGTTYFGYHIASVYSGWSVFSSVVSLIFMIGTIALSAMSISFLKVGKKKGWTLLFCVLLFQAVSIVVNAILTYSIISFIFSVIFGAVCIAIGAYFLFEIRSYYGDGFVEPKEEAKAETEKKAEE